MEEYKTPGIYIEEIPAFPPTVAEVETAIPAFVGYTQKATKEAHNDLLLVPTRIQSLLEYRHYFGEADIEMELVVVINSPASVSAQIGIPSKFQMYYSLQLFFANGGSNCYIVSVGGYTNAAIIAKDLETGLDKLKEKDPVTLIAFPDALNLPDAKSYYQLQEKSIQQCALKRDRFALLDLYRNTRDWQADLSLFRQSLKLQTGSLKYAAAYFPGLVATLDYQYKDPITGQDKDSVVKIKSPDPVKYGKTLAELKQKNNTVYLQAKQAINDLPMLLPASPAIAGVYATIDRSRGVWKAPANVNINLALRPAVALTENDNQLLNIDSENGYSVNVIREFTGRGPAIVWGARTLAGNDNEWRYISVRRYFNLIEESLIKSTSWVVFEPNTAATWVKVKAMIQNYLILQWRQGALQGAKPEEAFFVHAGLGETMTAQDVLEGRLIVEVGMAVVRPAEFILLQFVHKLLQE